MFIRTDLSIEFPYDIEEEYRTEEFETRNLKQKYYSEWKNNTEYRRASNSPEDSFLTYFWREILRCHTYEDGIISAHDQIDEYDIKQSKYSCRSEEMKKVGRKSIEHKSFLEWMYSIEK